MAAIEEQLVDSSRKLVDLIVAHVGSNQQLFDEAVAAMLKDKYPLSMRAARIVEFASLNHPHLPVKHIDCFISCLSKSKIDGVKRSILKVFIDTPLTLNEDQTGYLTDCCFSLAADQKESIAVRAFSIDILLEVLKQFPELKPELKSVIESIVPEASIGLKTKCKKLLKKM